MGDLEELVLADLESTLGYHPFIAGVLTDDRKPAYGQCQVGSLTGAVASQNVTEAHKGSLSPDGNRAMSINV